MDIVLNDVLKSVNIAADGILQMPMTKIDYKNSCLPERVFSNVAFNQRNGEREEYDMPEKYLEPV